MKIHLNVNGQLLVIQPFSKVKEGVFSPFRFQNKSLTDTKLKQHYSLNVELIVFWHTLLAFFNVLLFKQRYFHLFGFTL